MRNSIHGPIFTGLTALVAAAPLARAQSAEDFVAWAREAAIPIETAGGWKVPVETLAPLVGDARFVYLGEPDHYIAEKYDFRLAFLRTLHELGWRHLGMEMGRSDGLRFDRYLETGDEEALLEVGLYADFRGLDPGLASAAFFAEEFAYARAVRAIASGEERVHYFGFDLDMRPGNGRLDAAARLAGLGGGARDLVEALDYAWNDADRTAALEALLEEVEDPDAATLEGVPEPRARALRLDLFGLLESLRFQGALAGDLGLDVVARFARREEAMFRIMDGTLEELGPDARVVLTGHNMHLGRSWEDARWSEMDDDFEVTLWPSIGAHVTRRFPEEVHAIWLVYDQGERRASGSAVDTITVESVPGTLEALLANLPHDVFLLPLSSDDPRAAWLDREQRFRVNGGVAHGVPRRLADALCFVRRATPPQPDE